MVSTAEAIAVIKPVVYDWGGWNQIIFLWVNAIQDPVYDQIMIMASILGGRKMLPFYAAVIIAYALCMALVRRLRFGPGHIRVYLRGWLSVLLIIGGSFVLYVTIVGLLKHGLGFPRPFVALGSDKVRQIGELLTADDFYASFPSGHAAFSTLMVTALWPVLWTVFRPVGVLFVIVVCWSRMALGVHFPADVIAGVIVGYLVTRFMSRLVYRGIGYV